ncbi:galactose mutarotase [Lucilia sericata]|uniref:galactose mutarotase n=1 Tax=Lucilia sericata TaxID=13632 RepID=UPI0018A853FE|nr:galactose mutarotase [Lucilia sericata]
MVRVIEDVFGTAINPLTKQSEQIKRFTLQNDMEMKVQVISLGATITSIQVPDANGHVDDIALGYDDIAGYQTSSNPYFGATVGRVCNRIANGRIPLKGQEIQVSRNFNNKHQLHGGFIGFDKVHWQVEAVHQDGITLKHYSPDGHEGYPGQVTTTVKFTLTEDNCLHVQMQAETTKVTAVNMTNHTYFNLAGHNAGQEAIFEHTIMIKADKITETDAESIPTGNFKNVEGTLYDLRTMKNLGEQIKKLLPATNGYDDNYCVEKNSDDTSVSLIAKAYHPKTGRWLEIASNQPGVQFYTANYMPDTTKGETPLQGKSQAQYVKQGAFCLETQKYPDAVNHPNFPSIILNPGECYNHEVIYKFGTCRNGGCKH